MLGVLREAGFSIKLAWGVYTQSPGYEKLLQADYFMDLTSSVVRDLESQRAEHALLSLERELPAGLVARVEGYHKAFDRLIVGRLETPQETAARIATYDFPTDMADSVPREPWITTVPTSSARGRAYGFDLYLSRRSAASSRLTGWASYTYGGATRDAYGRTYPFDYDRRHAAAGARARARRRRTPRLWHRSRWRRRPQHGATAALRTARRAAHLDPPWARGRFMFYVDAINVLNRKNARLLEPRLEHDPTSDRPRLVEDSTGSLPFLPSFGVHVNFNGPARRAK